MRILLVEDNADHRELMWSALTEYDATWQVEGVVSGEAALRRLAEGEAYDLVFLDYSLPRRDGLEVLEEIRRGEAPPPVVVVTGRGDERVAVEAMKGGAYDYVVKSEGYLQRLPVVVQLALVAHQLAVERKRAREALRESEEKYRTLVEQSLQGLVIVQDLPPRIVFANSTIAKILGYSTDELVSLSSEEVKELIHPEDRAIFFQRYQERLEGIEVLSRYEVRGVRKDGTTRWVELLASGIEFHGKPAVHAAFVDITERKQAEEELLRSRADWEDIFQAIGHPTLILDPEHKVIEVNRAVAKATGATEEELRGKKCYEIFHGTDQPPEGCPFEKMSASGRLETIEMEMEALGGWFLVSCTPVFDEKGDLRNIIHIATDITERKRLEEILEKERQELKLIINASPIIIFYKDKEGRLIRVNKTFTEALKMPEEDLMGKTVFDLYSAKIAQDMTDDDGEVLKSVRPKLNIIEQYESASGIRWVQTDKIPICDKNGIPVGLIGFAQDITERKRAEETLWESQELYRSLFEGVPIGLYRTMPSGEILDINLALVEILGYPDRESLLVVNLVDMFVNPDERKQWETLMESQGVVHDFEAQFRRYDGTMIWIRNTCHAARHDDGQTLYHEGAIQDITERKQAEEALRKSQQLLAKTFSSLREAVFIIDDGTVEIIDCNPAASEIFGYSREEMIGRNVALLHIDEAAFKEFRRYLSSAIAEKGFLGHLESRMKRKDGTVFPTEHNVMPLEDEQGRRVGWVSVVHDITERKRAEEQMRSSSEQLRALSVHLQSIREEERTLIAREIHDELGQELTGLKMDLSWLIKRLPGNQELLVKKTESMSKLVDTTIQSVRRISTKLRPGVLDDLGLTAATEWQAQDFQDRTGIQCEFSSNLREIDLDRDRSTTVFRILQETLTNVARHASATRVNICLNEEAASLVLIVEDNGRGITEREISDPKSLGLLGMRERALVFGGEVEISGAPGKGTTVTLRIPIQK